MELIKIRNKIYYFALTWGLGSIVGSLCLSLITFWLIITTGRAWIIEPNIPFVIFEFSLAIFGMITFIYLIGMVMKYKIL